MSLNITLIAFIILMILGMVKGYQKGLVKGIGDLIALIVTVFMLAIISMIASSFNAGNTRNTVYSVVLLVALGTIYGIIKRLFKSLKAVTNLPFIGFLNSIAGIVIGLVWVMLLAQTVFVLAHADMLWGMSDYIMKDILNSKFLTIITLYNPFMQVL